VHISIYELDGRETTLLYRAAIDARVAYYWALTGATERALSGLRAASAGLARMKTRNAASAWVTVHALGACLIHRARHHAEPWLTSCLRECVGQLHAMRGRLPTVICLFLEAGRVALGDSSLAGLKLSIELVEHDA
jgi:hypothetical protein